MLESDVTPADLWLRALVQLPFPLVAAYTSGGRSVHALLRVNAESKAEWDAVRHNAMNQGSISLPAGDSQWNRQ